MKREHSRRFHKVAFFVWATVGLTVSIFLRNSVLWVVILSVYAVLIEHLLGWLMGDSE